MGARLNPSVCLWSLRTHLQGYLKRGQARQMFRIDVNKTGKIYDYFVAVGWVRPAPVADGMAPATIGDAGGP